MEAVLAISSVVLWVVVLFNLLLTLALVRKVNSLPQGMGAGMPQPELLKSGEPAPAFRLPTLQGQETSLADYAGREVAMVFVSPSCSPCRAQMPTIKELYPQAKRQGTELLVVSLGGPDETQTFVGEFQLESPVLVTQYGSSFATEYKVAGTPSYYLIDKSGKIKEGGFFDNKWQELTKKWSAN
jgi:methylamine dehydrogenase accessory protein MauD